MQAELLKGVFKTKNNKKGIGENKNENHIKGWLREGVQRSKSNY